MPPLSTNVPRPHSKYNHKVASCYTFKLKISSACITFEADTLLGDIVKFNYNFFSKHKPSRHTGRHRHIISVFIFKLSHILHVLANITVEWFMHTHMYIIKSPLATQHIVYNMLTIYKLWFFFFFVNVALCNLCYIYNNVFTSYVAIAMWWCIQLKSKWYRKWKTCFINRKK